jgi:hypothetical protein
VGERIGEGRGVSGEGVVVWWIGKGEVRVVGEV